MSDHVALLDNHLAFLAAHRGEVRRSAAAIEVVGESPEFSAWIPLSPSAELPPGTTTVRLVPWSGDKWEHRLIAAGFEPAEVLVHMEATVVPEGQEAAGTSVAGEPVRGEAGTSVVDGAVAAITIDEDATGFAEVQGAAFLDEGEPDYDWWRQKLLEMALKNYRSPEQSLYLLRVDGDPASVTLVLRTGAVFGVYAVATKPAYRGRGLASALLAQARQDAAVAARAARSEDGDGRTPGRDGAGGEEVPRLTLQVVEGSEAERLYLKLGFRAAFRSPHFRRP